VKSFEKIYALVLLDDDHTDLAGAIDEAKGKLLAKGFDLREYDVEIRIRHLTDAEHLRRLALSPVEG
jgi:hypothetical protein